MPTPDEPGEPKATAPEAAPVESPAGGTASTGVPAATPTTGGTDSGALAYPKPRKKRDMPGGLWMRCEACESMIFKKEMERRSRVCPECGYHFKITSRERIDVTLDPGSFEEEHADMAARDRLGFFDRISYAERLKETEKKTGHKDCAVIGRGRIKGQLVYFGAIEFNFIGGSMGAVMGEKIAIAFEQGRELHVPVIVFSASGGARMMEGALSLMQMAKTCAALKRLSDAGGLFISVLTDPTTGGVTASYASLGDVVIAEPGALIGFAGPRVIQETIKQELPPGFQRAEFMLEHGFVDRIVPRERMRDELAKIIEYCVPGAAETIAAWVATHAVARPAGEQAGP
ncbi:MAG: acetyl-CoA carboxylase carboxyltransferase subunit beta [Planctomycetes bacterium]|nr:acetyl-CoA carboxylase carboxyltransferase subunit beta [Planctomycetota bacterium]